MRLVSILLILSCLPAYAAPIDGRATVIDGDTIAVEGTGSRIRLDAIDAPENGQLCTDASGARYLCGSRAAESLADIIGRNGRVKCTEKERDRYGRIVAVCFAGGADINREMVRRGWAIEYKKYSDGRYVGAEAEARAARAGMWAGTFDEPAEWRKSKRVGEVSDTPAPARETPAPARATAAPLGLLAASGAATAALTKEMPTTTARTCKQVSSCREAVILWCGGYSRADSDGDGIPCENVCRSLAQVEPFKREIGCDR